jgi:hypothetical protein
MPAALHVLLIKLSGDSKRVLSRILLPFLIYAFHLTIAFHYCCTHLKFDIFPDIYSQNRGGSKLTRGSLACSFNQIIWGIKWSSPGLLKLKKLE